VVVSVASAEQQWAGSLARLLASRAA